MATVSLRDFFILEARHTPWRAPALMALAGVLAVAFDHAVLPLLPARAIQFMELGFRVEGMGAVLLVNDIMAVYFASFFAGVSGLLSVVITAREEGRLELLLAKPVRPAAFLAARIGPLFVTTLALGVLVSLACAAAAVPYSGPGASVSAGGAFGAGLFLTALVLLELAVLNIAFVRMRDGFYALLVACGVWMTSVLPSATFLYRPDLFEGREALTSALVLASLVWEARAAWLGPLAIGVAIALCPLLVRAAGGLLERTDSM